MAEKQRVLLAHITERPVAPVLLGRRANNEPGSFSWFRLVTGMTTIALTMLLLDKKDKPPDDEKKTEKGSDKSSTNKEAEKDGGWWGNTDKKK
jgi:hypothetical protein